MEYLVVVEKGISGYGAHVPDLRRLTNSLERTPGEKVPRHGVDPPAKLKVRQELLNRMEHEA